MLGLHEDREGRRVAPVEKSLVRLQRAIGGQAEAPQSRAGKLHRRLWAGGDEIPVYDCAVVDVVVPARITGGHQVLGCRAGVAALVQKAGSGKTGRRTTDSRDRNTGVQETRSGRGERLPTPGVPHVGARQDEQIAIGGVDSPPIVVMGLRDSATVTMFHGRRV